MFPLHVPDTAGIGHLNVGAFKSDSDRESCPQSKQAFTEDTVTSSLGLASTSLSTGSLTDFPES